MSDRRHFLKQVALFGAMPATPITFALGQAKPQIEPRPEPSDGSFPVIYRQLFRTRTPRRITVPDVGDFKVLKGDFHIHTLFSDGSMLPAYRVIEAVDNGLDIISITDHIEIRPYIGGYGLKLLNGNDDHNIAYDLSVREAEKQNIILVRGTEITKSAMPPGHFNALFIKDANPIAAVREDWRKMLAVATDQGGFIQWNHPGFISAEGGGLERGAPMRFMKEHEEAYRNGRLHGIEIFNTISYYPIVSQWCEERNLAVVANSDIHLSEWDQYGSQNPDRPMTLVLAKERSHDSVREAFFANRTIAFVAGMIIGRREWLEKLFSSCVTMTARPGLIELVNKSDIPCLVHAGGMVRELPVRDRPLSIYRSDSMKKLTVGNWLVDMNHPLEIKLE